ncbi:MAG: hypothetical protein AB1489_31720 [Acidobacteriota bacterium]
MMANSSSAKIKHLAEVFFAFWIKMLGYLSGKKIFLRSGDENSKITLFADNIKLAELIGKIAADTNSNIVVH